LLFREIPDTPLRESSPQIELLEADMSGLAFVIHKTGEQNLDEVWLALGLFCAVRIIGIGGLRRFGQDRVRLSGEWNQSGKPYDL
jgi:hypothetical protein